MNMLSNALNGINPAYIAIVNAVLIYGIIAAVYETYEEKKERYRELVIRSLDRPKVTAFLVAIFLSTVSTLIALGISLLTQ